MYIYITYLLALQLTIMIIDTVYMQCYAWWVGVAIYIYILETNQLCHVIGIKHNASIRSAHD